MIITERKIDKGTIEDRGQFRQLIVTEAEFSSLINSTKKVRYKYTVKRIVDTETIWLLSSAEDNILSIAHDGETCIPIWSSKEYGQNYCENMREEYKCKAISLYDFLNFLEENGHENDLKVSVFPTVNDLLGLLVSIDVFIQSVDEEQEWY